MIATTSTVGDGIRADSSNNQVTNTGTITNSSGISLGTTDNNNLAVTVKNTIINSGTIDGGHAVLLSGDGSHLDNSGTIKGFIPIELFGTGLGTITVKNIGTIESTTKTAIRGSTGADLINNARLIKGSLFLNDGNDQYDGRMGSVVSGRVELEAGDDVAYGGLLADSLYGGSGNDTLEGAGGDDSLMGGPA